MSADVSVSFTSRLILSASCRVGFSLPSLPSAGWLNPTRNESEQHPRARESVPHPVGPRPREPTSIGRVKGNKAECESFETGDWVGFEFTAPEGTVENQEITGWTERCPASGARSDKRQEIERRPGYRPRARCDLLRLTPPRRRRVWATPRAIGATRPPRALSPSRLRHWWTSHHGHAGDGTMHSPRHGDGASALTPTFAEPASPHESLGVCHWWLAHQCSAR